jgi:hypothetical protein
MVSVSAIFFVRGPPARSIAEGQRHEILTIYFQKGESILKGVNTANSKGALTFSEAYLKLFSLAKREVV